jgi:hypothetical protein
MKQAIHKTPLLDSLISISKENTTGPSGIPWDEIWKHEIELWLKFLSDEGQLERYISRICRSAKSKAFEALDEIKSAYFLTRICGFKVSEWEPRGQGDKIGEFNLEVGKARVFCEVKSPGWEREIVKLHGEYSSRLAEPKYISGEASSFDNTEDIREALIRAYEKFPDDQSCLLIFTSDLMISPLKEADPGGIPLSVNRSLYDSFNGKDGCFTNQDYERCSGVLLLDIDQLSEGITYTFKLYGNPKALWPLPKKLIKCVTGLKGAWINQ